MSVVVWDGKTMAADKQADHNSSVKIRVKKIAKINGCLVGGAGTFSSVEAMFNWFKTGADKETFPACQRNKDDWAPIILITPSEKILKYEMEYIPFKIEGNCMAIGSGAQAAMGAIYAGADSKQAICIASRIDPYCGMGIDCLTLDEGDDQ